MSSWFIPATWTLKPTKNHYYPLYTSKDGNRLFDNIRQLWHSAGMAQLNLVNIGGNLDVYLGDKLLARIPDVGHLTDEEAEELVKELWSRRK